MIGRQKKTFLSLVINLAISVSFLLLLFVFNTSLHGQLKGTHLLGESSSDIPVRVETRYKPVKGNPLPMIINAGMVYYMQFKTTVDQMKIPVINNSTFDLPNKDHGYALGGEANIFIPAIKGSVGLRWLGELGSRNRTQGNSFFITLAPYTKFFESKRVK